MDVPLIDLQKLTENMVQTMGDEKSKSIYLWTAPNKQFPEGRKDDTHLKVEGARKVAALATEDLKNLPLGLAKHVVPQRPVVGLDNWFNREHDKNGRLYHYIWSDTANSGFSQLGELFRKKGAELKTIGEEPTPAILGYLDVYIIVDPDTTSENPNPNYITPEAITAIKNWVKEGGVLVMLANDGPNCEFTHYQSTGGNFRNSFYPGDTQSGN